MYRVFTKTPNKQLLVIPSERDLVYYFYPTRSRGDASKFFLFVWRLLRVRRFFAKENCPDGIRTKPMGKILGLTLVLKGLNV